MSRNLFEYHPTIGYRFVPGVKARVRHEGGGYLVRCNQAGFRCDRELAEPRRAGRYRILLFGDSYTAGEGVSNGQRFGDLLEQRLPGVEVFNFGLPGSGTDQQYLAWREFARELPHDLLLLCPMVENIKRNLDTHRLTQSASDGRLVMRAKPYFSLEDGALRLHHIPVPKQAMPQEELPEGAQASNADEPARGMRGTLSRWVKDLDRHLPGFHGLTLRLRGVRWPPEYEDPHDPGWLLMRAILLQWLEESPAPALLCPIPTFAHLERALVADGWRARFAELGREAGVPVADLLPQLWAQPRRLRGIRFEVDEHPNRKGHALFADAIAHHVAPLRAAAQEAA